MDPGAGKIMERFQQECAFLESIQHPNIVQYLGMTKDPESGLPVLLMELLDESLTKMLERSQQSLAYCVQVDIYHDIALAVAYLHSNDIIHRDLSSNNVLMFAGRRAKVTDFGMSKLASAAPSMTTLTMCPGTRVYMPPEALREPPIYTKKLDCFSEGVIMIQVCTSLWPEPGPRNRLVPDSRSPTGMIDMPVLEFERRKNHIDLIDPYHPLLPITVDCLQFQDKDRPSSEELCQRLAALKETKEYRESVQNHHGEIQGQQLRDKSNQQPWEKQLQLRKITLNWRDGGRVPLKMSRGAAVTDGSVAYFLHFNGEVCSYDLSSKRWSELPRCPYRGGSLAIVNRQLTTIGGIKILLECTNKLLSLQTSQGKFIEVFPPMPTKRCGTNTEITKEHLIVAGGENRPSSRIATVEVMDVETLAWSTVASLPHPYCEVSASICGDQLYMLGGWADHDKGTPKSVLTCSLTELLQLSSSSSRIWHRVADAPAYCSTCAAVNGELLAVGGRDENDEPKAAIHKYNPTTNSWDLISNMPTARYRSLIAVLPTNEMMVVGGQDNCYRAIDKVEIATF